jgi:hypothetical protein
MTAFPARLAELKRLFNTDLRNCNVPLELSALLMTGPPHGFGVEHGLALLALPGFAVENIATADLQSFWTEVATMDASIDLTLASGVLLAMNMLHGVQHDKRTTLRNIFNGTATPIAGAVGPLAVNNTTAQAETELSERHHKLLSVQQGILYAPSQRLAHNHHMRIFNAMGNNGSFNCLFDLKTLHPQSTRRVVRKELGNSLSLEVEDEGSSNDRMQYITTAETLFMLFTALAAMLGVEVPPGKYPGTGGTLLVQSTDGSGSHMRVTARYTIVMAFCQRIILATGNYPTAMAYFILVRAMTHLCDRLQEAGPSKHPEDVWADLTCNGTHCFEPKAEHLATLTKDRPDKGRDPKVNGGIGKDRANARGSAKTKGCFNMAMGNCKFGQQCKFSHKPKLVAAAKETLANSPAKGGPPLPTTPRPQGYNSPNPQAGQGWVFHP